MRIRLNKIRWIGGFLAFQTIGGLLRKKPKVPKVEPIDAGAEQQRAIGANVRAFPQAAELGRLYQGEVLAGMERAIPQFGNILSQGSENILAMMRGELPESDVAQSWLNSSGRAFGLGIQGSPAHRNLVARDLGLASLQLQQQGQANALPWMQFGQQFSPANVIGNMFITPAQQIAVAQENQARQFSANWLRNQIKAAYDPSTIIGEAIIKTDDQIMEIASSVAGSLIGGMCWVAREVYGFDNFRWVLFREWLTTKGPRWLLVLYMRFGERFAKWIADKPRLKDRIRRWMDSRIATL